MLLVGEGIGFDVTSLDLDIGASLNNILVN